MRLNHLHLHVDDVERAAAFYETWFGLHELWRDGPILFLGDGAGFEFAVMADATRGPLPAWFHFGFHLPEPDDVRALYTRMHAAGVSMREPLGEEDGMVWFKCTDEDGYQVEVYWEPPK